MRLSKLLLMTMVSLLLAYSSNALFAKQESAGKSPLESNAVQHTLDRIGKKIDEKLNRTDFSGVEISEFKAFVHKAIKSHDPEKVKHSVEHILKSTDAALENYKDHKSECKVQQKVVGSQNMSQMNESCFRSFIGGLCPHWPFCK